MQESRFEADDPTLVKTFLASCRVGLFLRVLEEGEIGTGEAIELVSTDLEHMNIRDVWHLYDFDKSNVEDPRRALRIDALSPSWKDGFEQQLAKA